MFWIAVTMLLAGAIGGAMSRRRARKAMLPPLDDPRWGPQQKQIAGRPCVECGRKLIAAAEGAPCEDCGEIAHLESCLPRHVASAHGPELQAPYRR